MKTSQLTSLIGEEPLRCLSAFPGRSLAWWGRRGWALKQAATSAGASRTPMACWATLAAIGRAWLSSMAAAGEVAEPLLPGPSWERPPNRRRWIFGRRLPCMATRPDSTGTRACTLDMMCYNQTWQICAMPVWTGPSAKKNGVILGHPVYRNIVNDIMN